MIKAAVLAALLGLAVATGYTSGPQSVVAESYYTLQYTIDSDIVYGSSYSAGQNAAAPTSDGLHWEKYSTYVYPFVSLTID